jgi:hypothetical protein
MKKKINSIICLVLSFALFVTMSACSSRKTEDHGQEGDRLGSDNNPIDESGDNNKSDYRLVSENGEYFIVFDNPAAYQVSNQETATIDFLTMKEFKDSVTKGKLTDTQKEIMATAFPKNSVGAVKTCDFNNLYIPKLPQGCATSGVSWQGQSYSFELVLSNDSFGWLHYLTEDQFVSRFQEDYVKYFDKDTITVTKTEILEDGKEATFYSTRAGQLMNVRYTLSVGEKTIVVDKTFRLQMNNSELSTSSTVPSNVALYCTSDEGFYYISLYDFVDDPTDEWLLNFGLQKYVDNGYAVK